MGRLMLTALLVCLASTSWCDDLVYRHYFEGLTDGLKNAKGVDTVEASGIANRLMTVQWPPSMTETVESQLLQILDTHAVDLDPSAVAFYASHVESIPEPLFKPVLLKHRELEKPDKHHVMVAACYLDAIPAELLVHLNALCDDADDVVLRPIALAVLFRHSTSSRDFQAALLKQLEAEPETVFRAADALSRLPAEKIRPFASQLENLLDSTDLRVRASAAKALLKLNGEDCNALRVLRSLSTKSSVSICVGYIAPSNRGLSIGRYSLGAIRSAALRFERAITHTKP